MSDQIAAPQCSEVAAATAHSLNNLIATLYGASSYLEALPESAAVERARAAVDGACASAQALSAALYLLSLTVRDGQQLVSNHAFAIILDDEEQERLFDVLHEVAGVVRVSPDPDVRQATLQIDFDTLNALLICAAFNLRRDSGPQADLQCALTVAPAQPDAHVSFELRAPALSAPAGQAGGRSSHPCALALNYAAAMLPVACVSVQMDQDGAVRLHLPMRA